MIGQTRTMDPRVVLAVDIGPLTTVAVVQRGRHRSPVVFGDQVTVPTPTVGDGNDRDLLTALSATRADLAEPVIASMGDHLRAIVTSVGTVDEAVVTVPPAWGPRHHEMIKQAALRAGLPATEVISQPVAVATRIVPQPPGQAVVLVCELGQRASHLTVLQYHHGSWERVATRPVPEATGDRLDYALAQLVIPQVPFTDSIAHQLGHARRQLTAGAPAAIILPGQPTPIGIDTATLAQATQAVQHSLSEAAADILDAADVEPAQLHATAIYGECADALTASTTASGWPGRNHITAADGRLACAYGALDSLKLHGRSDAVGSLRIGWDSHGRQLVAPVVCALAGAVLLWQSIEIVARLMPPEVYRLASDYEKLAVYFDTAVWAAAGWALTLGCLTAGRTLAAALLADQAEPRPRRAGQVYAFCAVVGIAMAVLQGLLGQNLMGGPPDIAPPYLTAALAGAAVPALTAIVIGLAAPWWRAQPAWTHRIGFPVSSVVLAAAGILAVNAQSHGLPIPGIPHPVTALFGVAGAGLLGVAIALTVVTDRAARFVLGALLGAACMFVVGFTNLHSTVVVYLVAVGLWWIRRGSRKLADNLPRRWWQRLALTDTTPTDDGQQR